MHGPDNYIWLGTMRARMQGFVVFDYADQYQAARRRMSTWIANGSIKLPNYYHEGGVDAFPLAFQELYEGRNLGKMLLKLPAAD